MKILLISDTHGQHQGLELPDADLLIHAGDVSTKGGRAEVLNFLDWFAQQDARHKVFIAGNHDFFFENESEEAIHSVIPSGVIYLNDSGVEIEGVKIWGSPIQPWFYNWAFNRSRGAEIDQHWQLIPEDTDILITHGPPYGVLDKTLRHEPVGCVDLLNRIWQVKPKLHVFGHIHEDYGMIEEQGVRFVNASVLDVNYRLTNQPFLIDF